MIMVVMTILISAFGVVLAYALTMALVVLAVSRFEIDPNSERPCDDCNGSMTDFEYRQKQGVCDYCAKSVNDEHESCTVFDLADDAFPIVDRSVACILYSDDHNLSAETENHVTRGMCPQGCYFTCEWCKN